MGCFMNFVDLNSVYMMVRGEKLQNWMDKKSAISLILYCVI